MNDDRYEQLRLLDIDLCKGNIYGLTEGTRCPVCHVGSRFTIDKEYRPPEGIDPYTLKVWCTICSKDYYVVRSKK